MISALVLLSLAVLSLYLIYNLDHTKFRPFMLTWSIAVVAYSAFRFARVLVFML